MVDLGRGPSTFLPDLAARTAPDGRPVGVDESSAAVSSARGLIDQLGLSDRLEVAQARAQDSGLEPGTFDVVFIRNLLVHNGNAAAAFLDHSRRLLHPAGHLFSVEPDISGLRFLNGAAEEDVLERRWMQMAYAHRQRSDPGRRRPPDRLDRRRHENEPWIRSERHQRWGRPRAA